MRSLKSWFIWVVNSETKFFEPLKSEAGKHAFVYAKNRTEAKKEARARFPQIADRTIDVQILN